MQWSRIGWALLCAFLILYGAVALLGLSAPEMGKILGALAGVAGVILLLVVVVLPPRTP